MKKYTYILYCLSLAGVLFSGYLSSVKFFSKNCAFGETCPIFWGQPACYYGFAMFLVLFILSAILLFSKTIKKDRILNTMGIVASVGIVFSGNFVGRELVQMYKGGAVFGKLGLSTCAYGMIFYMLVFVFILRAKRVNKIDSAS